MPLYVNEKMNTKRIIITAGSFDLLHYGHTRMLDSCNKMGDELIVLLSTDQFGRRKGKVHQLTYEQRKDMLLRLKIINEIIPEEDWTTKYTVAIQKMQESHDVTFVIGDDWKGRFDDMKCRVIYLPRTLGISTTMIKEELNNANLGRNTI